MTTNDVATCLFAVVDALAELAYDPGRLFASMSLHAIGHPITRADQEVLVRLGSPRPATNDYRKLVQGKVHQRNEERTEEREVLANGTLSQAAKCGQTGHHRVPGLG